MAGILIASELGTGYGHAAKALLLARTFVEHGYSVTLAVKNLDSPLPNSPFQVLVTPGWPPGVSRPGPAVSYAELLARRGYCLPGRLLEVLRRWLELVIRSQADLLVADHAPTALLAARVAGVRSARVGTGFQAPPATTPLPPLIANDRRDDERERVETLVLDAINGALVGLGAVPASSVYQAIAPTIDFLCTFEEFDHYPARRDGVYYGPLYAPSEAMPPREYGDPVPGVFCYVDGGMDGFSQLAQALRQTGWQALVHARGLGVDEAARQQSVALRFVTEPIDVAAAARRSRLVVTHGGHGATTAALLAGCPVLLLPQHVEQLMFSRRLEAQCLAAIAPAAGSIKEMRRAIEKAAASKELAAAVTAFADRHRGYDPYRTAKEIAAAIGRPLAGA